MLDLSSETPSDPLSVEELIGCLRQRWRATYDLQLVVRRQRLYLQVMWAYLEQPVSYTHLTLPTMWYV